MAGWTNIKSLHELSNILCGYKKSGKRIVHCHGCFDFLHIGHIRYFQQAKQMGDILEIKKYLHWNMRLSL